MRSRPVTDWQADGREVPASPISNRRRCRETPLLERLQLTLERVSPLRDVAGAEADDIVALFCKVFDDAGKSLLIRERDDLPVSARPQCSDEMVAVDAVDGTFACGIDIGDNHRIGVVEAGGKRLEQRLQPRIAVR